MELAELVGLRPVPCAGLLLALTRRCPMHCAHCSSASTMAGEDPDPAPLLRFVGSFTAASRPELLMMTGGEPLLAPRLVTGIAEAARAAGTRSALLTGAFFARAARTPFAVRRAIAALDHFSVSMDVFHEREVPRADVFRLLRWVLDSGVPVSVHATGRGSDDPYLADLAAATRAAFGDRVPLLVNVVRPIGRARTTSVAASAPGPGPAPDPGRHRALPCPMAAWPVVAPDGEIVACCNQAVVDRRPVPGHLRLGHIATDDWPAVRERALASPVLRMIRAAGPLHLLSRTGAAAETGYCDACRRLSEQPGAVEEAERIASGAVGRFLDAEAARLQVEAGPTAFVRRHGCARYADLVALSSGTGRI